jgi:chromosome segregation protein
VYLKQLDIHGFKTFAEKTQIVFTPGVTAVIGPNGSGKSNISDAVLWVLGENNVRSIRGSSAQDVIFAGNERRRPLGMAEVSLTIDNSARIVPLDFSEITVTRRLYRSGESEFLINKVACRLKDIYELFLDTGVGRDAYSMVNQGEIDQILSVRAEDRRAIFEEAAGIKKYRVRKREAERKLEHTQQNLLRVNDIIGELESRLGPLQRQAAAAKRYRELAGKLRLLEGAWYGAKIKRLDVERGSLAELVGGLKEERNRLEAELSEAQAEEKAARDALQGLDDRAEELRRSETDALQRVAAAEAERVRAEERSGEVERRLRALSRELDELAGRIADQVRRSESAAAEETALKRDVDAARAALAEAQGAAQDHARVHGAAVQELERLRQAWLARARRQAELEARAQSLEGRLRSLDQDLVRARTAVEDAEAELQRLAAERESFLKSASEQQQRARALAAELDSLRETARKAEQGLGAARTASDAAARAHQNHAARLQALSELGERGEGAAAGAKMLLNAARSGQVPGRWSLLVDGLQVPEGLEKAVEAALGVYSDALLCDSEEHPLAALGWLRARKATALVLPGMPGGERESVPATAITITNYDHDHEEDGRRLGALVRGEPHAVAWARYLLAEAVLCDSLEEAQALRQQHSHTPTHPHPHTIWVTPTGEWLTWSGAVSGGPQGVEGSAAAALARRREVERLQQEAPALEAAAGEAREALRRAEAEVRQTQSAAREKQSLAEKARLEHQAQLRDADRRNQDVERARHRLERLRQEVARVEQEQGAAVASLAKVREDQAQGLDPEEQAGENGPLAAAEEAARKAEAERRTAEARVADLRVALAEQEQRLQGAVAASRRAVEGGAFLDRQRADRLQEQRALTAEREQRKLTFTTLAAEAAAAEGVRAGAREELAALSERRTRLTQTLNQARAGAQDLGNRLRELMERCHRAEVELTAVEAQRQNLGQQWLDAMVSGHSLEISEAEQLDEPLQLTIEGLLETWDADEAELTLGSYSDPEAEIGRFRRQIRALGAVNPDAVEQFAETQERFEFLTSQRADLDSAREQLEAAIRDIDAASRDTFMRAFEEIAAAFDLMFKKLFGGGATELRLTDPADVLETGIDIIVQPPGKKQQNLLLLSGGERALTASAMLFALLKVKPSPFCVMDEVDAPLDESNVGRFSNLLREFSARTQFIVVTHNRGTMEAADTLYGVTMEERGVSKVLSCSLADPVVAQVEAEQHAAGRAPVGAGA